MAGDKRARIVTILIVAFFLSIAALAVWSFYNGVGNIGK